VRNLILKRTDQTFPTGEWNSVKITDSYSGNKSKEL